MNILLTPLSEKSLKKSTEYVEKFKLLPKNGMTGW
jgi:hypothetical protein